MPDGLLLADKDMRAPGLIDKTNVFRQGGKIDPLVRHWSLQPAFPMSLEGT
jgi:hypothetical protein